MKSSSYKKYKAERKLYHNKVFSYQGIGLKRRNYSRKDFGNTHSKLVVFKNCRFDQTVFNQSKFDNCKFENCLFSNFEFFQVKFFDVTFADCTFDSILFNKCCFQSVRFCGNKYINVSMYPRIKMDGLDMDDINHTDISEELKIVLEKAKLQRYIRESNTIFKKVRNTWAKETKRQLKKIKKKEEGKLGYTKRQRLEENARRRKERSKLQLQNHLDSQLGKNRKIDQGELYFLLIKYSEEELINGIEYAIDNMKFSFHELSFLVKYIDKANRTAL